MTKYAYSVDEERYCGDFDSIEEAIAEGADSVDEGGSFWVGEVVPPPAPEDMWHAEDWLEHVSCQDEYSGDYAEGWDESTKAQRDELEDEVGKVMAAWLDRHDLRPKFFVVDDPKRYCREGDRAVLDEPARR